MVNDNDTGSSPNGMIANLNCTSQKWWIQLLVMGRKDGRLIKTGHS